MAYKDVLSPDNIESMVWKTLIAMQTQAVLMVPVDTGNLRNAITIGTIKRRRRYGPVIASRADKTGEIVTPSYLYNIGVLGVAVAYAEDVERGIPSRPWYPAQPFLRPAADWMRRKLGQISAVELKARMAAHNFRHPHMIVRVDNGSVSVDKSK